MPSPFTYGTPDGSQLLRPAFKDDRIELVGNIDQIRKKTLPLPWKGMHFGSGLAGKFPAALEDGVFLTLRAADTTTPPTGYGADPFGTGYSLDHGSNFYDFATNAATTQVFMAFSANTIFMAPPTNSNSYWLTDGEGVLTAVKNPNYTPGQFDPDAVTGLWGAFSCWYPKRLLSESSLAGYVGGGPVALLNGRPSLGVGGNSVIGKIDIVDTLKVLINFNLDNPRAI